MNVLFPFQALYSVCQMQPKFCEYLAQHRKQLKSLLGILQGQVRLWICVLASITCVVAPSHSLSSSLCLNRCRFLTWNVMLSLKWCYTCCPSSSFSCETYLTSKLACSRGSFMAMERCAHQKRTQVELAVPLCFSVGEATPFLISIFIESQLASHTVRLFFQHGVSNC